MRRLLGLAATAFVVLATIGRDGRNLRLLTKLSNNKPRYIDWGTAR